MSETEKTMIFFIIIALVTALFFLSVKPQRKDPRNISARSQSSTHLYELSLLVNNTLPENTSYQHKPTIVSWGSDTHNAYICQTDCSELISSLLMHTYTWTRDDLQAKIGKKRPYARDYFRAIVDEQYFERVRHIQDVAPGDFIAVTYPLGFDDTGHIMVVHSKPIQRVATPPLISERNQWDVEVIDCTKKGHGLHDSRRIGKGVYRPGIGKGFIRLYTTRAGDITGYTWSTSSTSIYNSNNEHPLAIGRLISE